jgi:hypothetical protein
MVSFSPVNSQLDATDAAVTRVDPSDMIYLGSACLSPKRGPGLGERGHKAGMHLD